MKRLWLGVGLLGLLLVLGLGVTWLLGWIHGPTAQALELAVEVGSHGDWSQAQAQFARARSRWEKYYGLTAAVTDHKPMEDIDAAFARNRVYLNRGANTEFLAGCAGLARQVENMEQAQGLAWWDFL